MIKTIYRKIAFDALLNWYYNEGNFPAFTSEQREQMAKIAADTWSFEKLEKEGEPEYNVYGVGAEGSITAGVKALVKYLGLDETFEERLLAACLNGENEHSKEDEETFLKVQTEAQKEDAEVMALYCLSAIHDAWVESSAKKYDRKDGATRYMHLPLELIGYEEAVKDLLFMKPILEACGVELSEIRLRNAYDKMVKNFLNKQSVHSQEDLEKYILNANQTYTPLTAENSAKDEEMAKQVAGQVLDRVSYYIYALVFLSGNHEYHEYKKNDGETIGFVKENKDLEDKTVNNIYKGIKLTGKPHNVVSKENNNVEHNDIIEE